MLQRPALGQWAELGALYDARTDSFTEMSLLSSSAPASAISVADNHRTDVSTSFSETYGEKLSRMKVNAELGASVLSGLIDVSGSASYLTHVHTSDRIVHMSLHYSITTVNEKLNFSDNEVQKILQLRALRGGAATHVVTQIGWGARCVVTAKHQHQVSNDDDRTEITGRLQSEFAKLTSVIKISGEAELEMGNSEHTTGMSFDVAVYGDVLATDGLLPTDLESAYKFIKNVPGYVASANGGKGKPITYTLLPLNHLAEGLGLEIKANVVINQLRVDCLERFVWFFDNLCKSKQKLNDHYADVEKLKICVPAAHHDEVAQVVREMIVFEAAQKSSYARILKEVRSGEAQPQELEQLLRVFSNNEDMSPERIHRLTNKYCSKMHLADFFISKGVRYIGDDATSLSREILLNPQHNDAYVFYWNEEVMHNQSTWDGNLRLLLEFLEDKKKVIIVDMDMSGTKMEKSCIKQYRNGSVIFEDLLEQNQLMADKSFARWSDEKLLDGSSRVEKPLGRSPVRIRCPGPNCIQDGKRYDWICFKCHALLEYADHYFYCDCGRAHYSNYEFKCKEPKHGSAYAQYDSNKLLGLLDALEPFPELNILILGETGVGKSTFINAFMNYLTFDTLDDALKDEKLHWVIPCSFPTVTVDSSGGFVGRDVKIGLSDNYEHDGTAGQSATQKPCVYPVVCGDTIVRLIDTPGIGDTRGVEWDDNNMADILGTIRHFSSLHGILILLKPNDSRLTLVFRFCVTKLLTHLHRDAVSNMVFGFTTTRISSFQPGDTFKPLQTLLKNHKDAGIALTRSNVYCFDSESFRFLAARKSGMEMGNINDSRSSWEHSRDETRRLVRYVGTLRPHLVRGTITLNETRELIKLHTKLIADTISTMDTTIRENQDALGQIESNQVREDLLRQYLHFEKVELRLVELKTPRTVCAHKDCVEDRDDGPGGRMRRHKSKCHDDCYVWGASVFLCTCKNMNWKGFCKVCKHYWWHHEHVRYELYEASVTVTNSVVEKELKEIATDFDLKKNAIEWKKAQIRQAEDELKQVRAVAVKFGLFLKQHCITPYNDVMLEYLDHHIRQELEYVNGEAQNGGNSTGGARLDKLKRLRKEYKEEITLIQELMKTEVDESLSLEGVDQLVQSLYRLPLWGDGLKDLTIKAALADRRAYREKPYRLPRRISQAFRGVFRGVLQWGDAIREIRDAIVHGYEIE